MGSPSGPSCSVIGWSGAIGEGVSGMSANAEVVDYFQAVRCTSPCPFTGAARAHHDELLMVDRDIHQAMSLIELAVTWGELDYSDALVIGPAQWTDFVASHRWLDRDLAERVFRLAADAAGHSVGASFACVV
jgi:hypothetical protein